MQVTPIKPQAEFLDTLRQMVTKTASTAGTASGVPGQDTNPAKTPEATEHVNKNEQGHPEKNPQDFKQEKGKDGPLHGKAAEDAEKVAAPVAGAAELPNTTKPKAAVEDASPTMKQTEGKKAEAAEPSENLKLAEMAERLLAAIEKAQVKEANTAGKASGVPGKDTNPASMGEHTEKVNKNEQGHPEKLEQNVEQHPGKDGPIHGHAQPESKAPGTKAAEQDEIDKQASFELGRQFCRSFLQTKVASEQEMYKEAGRRDFETLIAQAAAELDQEPAQVRPVAPAPQVKQAAALYDESYAEKQAEEAGAQTFYAMMKQAQDEYQAEQINQAFEQKIAAIVAEKAAVEKRAAELETALKEKTAAIEKKAEEDKRAAEFAYWGQSVVTDLMNRLKSEPAR